MQQVLNTIRSQSGSTAAIVFVHGFGGDFKSTWQDFPTLLAAERGLSGWDIYSLGYDTHLRADLLVKIWSADPDLNRVAGLLWTEANDGTLARYKSLTLIAHSMGGLAVQRAVLDHAPLRQRLSHLFLFGTPSNGLVKAWLARLLKPQLENMAKGGAFIEKLRADWRSQFPSPKETPLPFHFVAVAGESDEFVPAESSLGPFPEADYPNSRLVVPGNHIEMVKPADASSLTVQLTVKRLMGTAAVAGPMNSAMIANQLGEFNKAVSLLEPLAKDLDDAGLVQLALALEGVGRHKDAIETLRRRENPGLDVMGTLAGRLKRAWLLTRVDSEGRQAQALYEEGLKLALAKPDHEQAYYHGINVAFMRLAREDNVAASREMATAVLEQCTLANDQDERPSQRKWRFATEGEAQLLLGRRDEAYAKYRLAAAPDQAAKPRELESMHLQAMHVSGLIGDESMRRELNKIFRPGEAT